MGQDFWRSEREAEAKAKSEPAPESPPKPELPPRPKPATALESDWREHSWERYMEELRRKYEGVSNA
jgi:hypothetical protein